MPFSHQGQNGQWADQIKVHVAGANRFGMQSKHTLRKVEFMNTPHFKLRSGTKHMHS